MNDTDLLLLDGIFDDLCEVRASIEQLIPTPNTLRERMVLVAMEQLGEIIGLVRTLITSVGGDSTTVVLESDESEAVEA